jgi:GR25 family glycosyltransferase involved in LPS biosynthesis|tara:strand:+ start:865 stop:1644 length:780 start_codon:yes stop_codon:yes gene_type:complete
MQPLTELFDRVYVISCSYRKDRLDALEANFKRMGVADFSQVRIFKAIDGNKVGSPPYWKWGRGAWGCYQSHCGVITDILNSEERCRSALILEDDVCFNTSSLVEANYLMNHIPPDWDQVYLGGQHCKTPEFTDDPLILKGTSIHRTHAYGLNEKVFKKFYAHLSNAPEFIQEKETHVDRHLEAAHQEKKWNVYCPLKWVAGQASGESDIAHITTSDGVCSKKIDSIRKYWYITDSKAGMHVNKADSYFMGDKAPIVTPL